MGRQCMEKHSTSPVSTFRVQKHRMARHFARLDDSHIVAKVLHCSTKLGSEWKQREWRALSTHRLLEMGTRFRALYMADPLEAKV